MTNATIFLINATRVKPVTHVKNILIHVTNTSFIKIPPTQPADPEIHATHDN